MPVVSIIMGAYNCESTIDNCVKSILNQTYIDWEFIICDDCSIDRTYNILQKYAVLDKRIIVLRNRQNIRLAASLNRCLEIAKGKYIARMDSDDECLPTRLEEQVNFLDHNEDYDVVGCELIISDGMKDQYVRRMVEYPSKEILKTRVPFAHPTIMMRKHCYDVLKGYTVSQETMRAEDLDLWFRFYEKGFGGYNIQKPLYRYHESKGDYSKRTLQAAVQTSKVYLKGYKRLNLPWYVRLYALKPILSVLVPRTCMMAYHALIRK